MSDLTDDQRKNVYMSLLRGMARGIREAPDSCERIGHDWTPWIRHVVRHDSPTWAISGEPPACQETFLIVAERHCQQCGLEQRS
jgi:hypothetical protein